MGTRKSRRRLWQHRRSYTPLRLCNPELERLPEVEGVAELVGAITFDEDLAVHLTAQVTVCGELTDQDLQVVACDTVGVSIQSIPGTPDGVINGNVSSWRPKTRVKVGGPGLSADCTVAMAASPWQRLEHLPNQWLPSCHMAGLGRQQTATS